MIEEPRRCPLGNVLGKYATIPSFHVHAFKLVAQVKENMQTTSLCRKTSAALVRQEQQEAELIARARASDPAALALLVNRFHNAAVGFAYLHLRDRNDAEDAVQTAWTKALWKLDQFRGTAKFSTWLFTIVLNECRTFQKRFRNRRNTSLEDAMGPGQRCNLKAALSVDLESDYERRQLQTRMRQQIGRLPATYRRVMWLHYVAGLPLGQVASLLKITTSAVKSRIMRARAELRVTLESCITTSGASRRNVSPRS